MEALYAAQYAQDLRSIRVGLDILDLAIDPQRYLATVNENYYHPIHHARVVPDFYYPPRPKKNEVDRDSQSPMYKTDDFRINHFKVHECSKQYSHCYKHCPFAHKNEYAKRRSPQEYAYSCIMCPDQDALNNGRTSNTRGFASKCHRGDACAYSHSNLERHLHPDMYRTERCNAISCHRSRGQQQARPVCFFAHCTQELRVIESFAVPIECLEPFMFTPGTREYELAGRSSTEIVRVDFGVFQRVASNKLAARARAKKACAQLDAAAVQSVAALAAAEERRRAMWDPWRGSQVGLGTTAFPKLNLLDITANHSPTSDVSSEYNLEHGNRKAPMQGSQTVRGY